MSNPDRFARFGRTDSVRADVKQKSIRSAVFVASGNVGETLVRFLSIAVLARLLLPEDFGLVAIVMALTSILDSFRDFGLSTATIQRPEITHHQVSNLFWANTLVGMTLALMLTAAAPFIAAFYQDERLVGISIALAFMFVWNGLSVQHEALMVRQLRQGELVVVRLVATIISVALAVLLALGDWGYWALVWREITRIACISVGVWLCCLWLPGLPRRNVGTRSLFRFGGELSAANLLSGLIAQVDKLLIGRFFGAGVVGIYRQAQQLVLVPVDQLNYPIMSVAQPALSALQLDSGRYRKFYEKTVFLVTMGTVPLGLFVAVCAKEITLLMLGPAWIDATVFVRIFGIAAAIRPAVATSAAVLVTFGMSRRFLIITIVHSLALTALMSLGLMWGATGVAIAQVGTTLLLAYPKLYFSFLGTPATIRGFLAAGRTPAISGLAMAIGLVVVRQFVVVEGPLGSLLLSACVAGAVYCAAMWLQPVSRAAFQALVGDVRAALKSRVRTAT